MREDLHHATSSPKPEAKVCALCKPCKNTTSADESQVTAIGPASTTPSSKKLQAVAR